MTLDEMGAVNAARIQLDSLAPTLRAEVLSDYDVERATVHELVAAVGDAEAMVTGDKVTLDTAAWLRIAMAYHNAMGGGQ